MGSEFDAELYLRRLGEDWLAGSGSGRSTGQVTLAGAAGALVAVGVIDGDLAQGVVDGYRDAIAVRGGGQPGGVLRAARARLRESPRPVLPVRERRVARCEHVIERDVGTLRVRQVHVAADETTSSWIFILVPF